MTEPVLATHGLRKAFGALQASDGITLDLRPGEIHAIIGPNGAGKSTLIAQICGALAPDEGRVDPVARNSQFNGHAQHSRQISGQSPYGSSLR